MRTKQQVVTEFRRDAILAAARSVFARRGFARGIMDDIAREAGLAKGTLYLYFHSKREIYQAMIHADMQNLKLETNRQVDAADGLRQKIRAFIVTRMANAERNRELFRIMDQDSAGAAVTRSQYHAWVKEPVLHLAQAIAAAAAGGEIQPRDAERAAWAVADLIRGTVMRRMLSPSRSDVAAEADALLEFIWVALEKR